MSQRKAQLRQLLRAEKDKSKTISPFLHHQDGQLQCKLCKVPLKNENFFVAHSKTKLHLTMLQKLKQAKLKRQQAPPAAHTQEIPKEKQEPQAVTPKTNLATTENQVDPATILPASFFDNPATPEQKKTLETQVVDEPIPVQAKLTNRELFALMEEEEAKEFHQEAEVQTNNTTEIIEEKLPEGFFDKNEQEAEAEVESEKVKLDKAFEEFKSELAQEHQDFEYSDEEAYNGTDIEQEILREKAEEKEQLEHLRKITSTIPTTESIPGIILKSKKLSKKNENDGDDGDDAADLFSLFNWRNRKI